MSITCVRSEILYAWQGAALLVTTPRGECGDGQTLSGFYYREARFLRTFRLEINGHELWLCESAMVRPDLIECTYVYPEITQPGGGGTGQAGDEEGISADGLPERGLDIRVACHVRPGRLEIVARLTNRARRAVTFDVAAPIAADFADIQEAQVGRRQQEGAVEATEGDGRVELRYRHPQLPYRSEVRYSGWTEGREAGRPFTGRLMTRLTLAPQESRELSVRVIPHLADDVVSDDEVAARETALERWRSALTTISVPENRLFERVLERNVRDFASYPLLDGPRDEWLAMQAGMPVYPAFFGRDAVTAGWQAAMLDRGDALDAALTRLARMQTARADDWHDEQPGRIPYQMRSGPLLGPGLRFAHGREAHAGTGRGTDQCRKRIVRSRYPAAGELLCGQARAQGVHRHRANGARRGRGPRSRDPGQAGEHRYPLLREGSHVHGRRATAGAACLRAGSGVRRDSAGRGAAAARTDRRRLRRQAQRRTVCARVADKYMERWTFDSQKTNKPTASDRRDNLYAPVAGDGGERGRNWTGHTRSSSVYTSAMLHPAAAVGVLAVAAGISAWVLGLIAHRRIDPPSRAGYPEPVPFRGSPSI